MRHTILKVLLSVIFIIGSLFLIMLPANAEGEKETSEITTSSSDLPNIENDSQQAENIQTGTITFEITVPSKLSDEHDYVELKVYRETDESLINIRILKSENWVLTTSLPLGHYQVICGGIPNDWRNEFPIDGHIEFDVTTSNSAAKIKFLNSKNQSKIDASTVSSGLTNNSAPDHGTIDDNVNAKITNQKGDTFMNAILFVVGFAIGIILTSIVWWIIFKKYKNNQY
jgi:heme/copper-type cytochrome/quinol oxidase subunit 4